jgi:hypothetical protein
LKVNLIKKKLKIGGNCKKINISSNNNFEKKPLLNTRLTPILCVAK